MMPQFRWGEFVTIFYFPETLQISWRGGHGWSQIFECLDYVKVTCWTELCTDSCRSSGLPIKMWTSWISKIVPSIKKVQMDVIKYGTKKFRYIIVICIVQAFLLQSNRPIIHTCKPHFFKGITSLTIPN